MIDRDRLLAYFRDHPNQEICCTTLVEGDYYGTKKIIEYTGRIKNARDFLGCTCGEEPLYCQADEHIINTRKGYYKFVTQVVEVKELPPFFANRTAILQAKRDSLAKDWMEANRSGDEVKRKIIETVGKRIRRDLDMSIIEDALT